MEVRAALDRLEWLVVQDPFLTDTARMAHAVLPACTSAEKDGTFTNLEGRVLRVREAIDPIGESLPDWHIMTALANALGCQWEYESSNDIQAEIMKLLPDQLLGGMGMPQLNDEQTKLMEKELKRTESIIDSMTWHERTDHKILNANRRRRIARGSGTSVAEVNQLVKQYTEMRQMMRQLSSSGMFGGSGIKSKMMRRMTGMPDLSGMEGNGGDPVLPAGPSRKKLKKKRKKRKR